MAFLYYKYKSNDDNTNKIPKKIDFNSFQDKKDARGKAAEAFALKWEKERLRGDELDHLIKKIDDRTERPGYGYDFLSHNSDGTERFIEVKSVRKLNGEGTYRFYASSNQKLVSEEHKLSYYLYLVYFDDNGKPIDLDAERAHDFYQRANIDIDTFVVIYQNDDH